MSLAIADVRRAVQDVPYCIPKPGEYPEIIGTGDGTSTTFFMSLAPYTGSALTNPPGITVYTNTNNAGWVQSSSSNWSIQNGNQVVFTVAPSSSVVIGIRYYFAVFSDSDLTAILTQAQGQPQCNTDQITLYQCQYDIAGMLLMNRAQMVIMRRSDIVDDINQFASGLMKMRADLAPILFGAQRPGANIPFLVFREDFTGMGNQIQR